MDAGVSCMHGRFGAACIVSVGWLFYQVAGLAPVTCIPGIENVDVTGLVKSHANYPEKVPQIMSFISIEM